LFSVITLCCNGQLTTDNGQKHNYTKHRTNIQE
jgi:hypothetical protein